MDSVCHTGLSGVGMKFFVASLIGALAMAGAAIGQTPPPAAAFGRLPAVQQAVISPNGQMVAILGGTADDRTVTIASIDKPGVPVLKLGKVETVAIRWAGDAYILVRAAYWDNSLDKVAYRLERNYAATPDGKVASRLLDNDIPSQWMGYQPILGITPTPKLRVMMLGIREVPDAEGSANTRLKRKGERAPIQGAIWSVDPANGNGVMIEAGDFDTVSWETDLMGRARVRFDRDDLNHGVSIFARPKETTKWERILTDKDEEGFRVYYGYSDKDDAVYLGQHDQNGTQIVRRSLKDGLITPIGHPSETSDISLVWDEGRGVAVGLATGRESDTIEWLDPEIGAVSASMLKVFKGKHVTLASWSDDRNRFVVETDSQDTPPAWFLFDRAKKELSPIGEAYPDLKDAKLGSTSWINYKAKDGLEIPAYLTLPPGAQEGRGKLPLIVLPHGGPAARDSDGFSWLTQFLASRGYAVLRPQFRGSTGFGRAFELAGRGEWGGKMQTDLLDGVASLAAGGKIDPLRVCIVGWSFGGYAALAGAALHPEAYRCAASFAGIGDLTLLIREDSLSYGDESGSIRGLRRTLGNATLAEQAAASPMQHVNAIRAPVLLMHADQDTVVSIEQSRRMAAAMTKAGKPVEFVTIHGDDHYLMHSATRIQMADTLGAFLAKNLPVTP